jgi:hypothetical protein
MSVYVGSLSFTTLLRLETLPRLHHTVALILLSCNDRTNCFPLGNQVVLMILEFTAARHKLLQRAVRAGMCSCLPLSDKFPSLPQSFTSHLPPLPIFSSGFILSY